MKLNGNHIYRPARLIVCAALIAVLLMSAALAAAASSGILTRLFSNADIPEDVKNAVISQPASITRDGITLTLDEYLIDEATLHFDWTVSSARSDDVYFTVWPEVIFSSDEDEQTFDESVGGAYGWNTCRQVGDDTMVHLSSESPAASGWADIAFVRPLTQPAKLQLTVCAYTSDLTPVSIDNSMDVIFAEECSALISALETGGQIGIGPDQLTSVAGYASFQKALETIPAADELSDSEALHSVLVASGLMKPLTELTLEVTLEPECAVPSRFHLEGEIAFTLPDRTVTLRALDVNAVSTMIEYLVSLDDTPRDLTSFDALGLRYILFDQDGWLLNVDLALNLACNLTEQGYLVSVSGNALPDTVTQLRFVPSCALDRLENESSNAYLTRMSLFADEASCFTVPLIHN